jgi:hypothetical protein
MLGGATVLKGTAAVASSAKSIRSGECRACDARLRP